MEPGAPRVQQSLQTTNNLITGGWNGAIRLWDIAERKEVRAGSRARQLGTFAPSSFSAEWESMLTAVSGSPPPSKSGVN